MIVSTVQHTLAVSAVATTALALVALGVTAILRRRGAAVRHLALATGLTACLLVPAPTLLPSAMTVRSPLAASVAVTMSPALAQLPVAEVATDAIATADIATRVTPGTLIAAVWLAGMLALIARFARQSMVAARLRARATRPGGSGWATVVAAVETELGAGVLDVRLSTEVDVPLVGGIRRPVIVLPASADQWPTEQRRLVLLHEGAHIARRDLLSRAVGVIACSVHWYNPLVWLLAARADEEAEQSADDLVLRSGVRPSEYASLLVSFAERLRWHPPVQPVLMLARRGTLAPRVHAVLAVTAPRPAVGRRAQTECAVLCTIVIVSVGCIRLPPPVTSSRPTRNDRFVEAPITREMVVAPIATSAPAVARPRRRATDAAESALAVVPGWRDEAIRALLDLREDPSPQVRASALEALGKLRHD